MIGFRAFYLNEIPALNARFKYLAEFAANFT